MRCPKCHYISFDSGDRCRNCGYDLSLTVDVKELDLPIHTADEPIGPMSDLDFTHIDGAAPAASSRPELPRDGGERQAPARHRDGAGPSPLDLPLFTARNHKDAPLVTPQPVPRPPLSVRRPAPAGRSRPHTADRPSEPELDLGAPEAEGARAPSEPDLASDKLVAAPSGRRLAAAAIDASILGAIDITVLYLTLKLCGLQRADLALIPVAPFAAFLLLLNGAYLVGFTAAAGQTIGKMAAGIRVVPLLAGEAERVPFGVAVLRGVACLLSVLPAGLGLVPALLGTEHRALHDRLADTRVVKA